MCNDCYDPVIEAIQKCSYDDECLQAETGFCYSCMCNVVAAMKLKFLNLLNPLLRHHNSIEVWILLPLRADLLCIL